MKQISIKIARKGTSLYNFLYFNVATSFKRNDDKIVFNKEVNTFSCFDWKEGTLPLYGFFY